MRIRPITPLLGVADTPEAVDALDAFVSIKLRDPAVVPDDATAREVLRMLGLGDDLIDDRLHFSRTGEVLSAG